MPPDDDKNKDDKNTPDPAKEMADLKASNAALMARLEKLEAGGKDQKKDDDSTLNDKVKKDQEAKDKQSKDSAELESALRFSLGSKDWLKTNSSLLPKEVEGLFNAAEKETYGSAIEKAQALKAGIIQSFFSIQANVDLLTPGLKSALEDYLKLTKNGKQERAQSIYDNVFEPAFEMLKRVKKAEQLRATGSTEGTDSETAYKNRMMALSKKHYLGEKSNGT